jgi:hypothetical protein
LPIAWLSLAEFQAGTQEDGCTLVTQTAFFAPRGLFGLVYWYALYPIHGLIFGGMIREIGRRAERLIASR